MFPPDAVRLASLRGHRSRSNRSLTPVFPGLPRGLHSYLLLLQELDTWRAISSRSVRGLPLRHWSITRAHLLYFDYMKPVRYWRANDLLGREQMSMQVRFYALSDESARVPNHLLNANTDVLLRD